MAKIRSFAPSTQNVSRHPSETDLEYKLIGDPPDQLLHLSTFGSDDRASHRKSSQSLQLDREGAAQLLRILLDAFPGLKPAS